MTKETSNQDPISRLSNQELIFCAIERIKIQSLNVVERTRPLNQARRDSALIKAGYQDKQPSYFSKIYR